MADKSKEVVRHDYALIMNQFLNKVMAKAISDDLEMNGFSCTIKYSEENKTTIFLLAYLNKNKILAEAERQQILKEKRSSKPEKQERKNKQREEEKTYLNSRIIEAEKKKPFQQAKTHLFEGGTYDTILNEAEKSRLIYIILSKIRVIDMYEIGEAFPEKAYPRIDQKETFLYFVKRFNFLEDIVPLHSNARASLSKKITKEAFKYWFVPTDMILEYYGEQTTMYFEWMNYFIKWLVIPGIFAFFIRLLNSFYYESLEKSAVSALYSVCMSIWAVMFVIDLTPNFQFWKRKCRSLYIRWGIYSNKQVEEDIRKEFQGVPRINPVSGRVEPMFSDTEKMIRYIKSFFICFPAFLFVFVVIVCFLNLTGVINARQEGGLFHIPALSQYAMIGRAFDRNTNYAFIPSILQSVITLVMNLTFKQIAIYATNQENHKFQSTYNNSLILKRFAFEFVDFYLYLFYIGLYQLNLRVLQTNIISLFWIDEARRIGTELLIPYLLQNRTKMEQKLKRKLKWGKKIEEKETSDFKQTQDYINAKELEELERDEVETFDDYLEMIITFGYITMFATAFPFASTISVVFIYFEARSDLFKIEKVSRRPMVVKTNSIGAWQTVLELLAFLSIFTNIILFTYASDQIDALIPSLKRFVDDPTYSVVTCFTIEHILVFITIILKVVFGRDQHWVTVFFDRRRFKKQEKKYKAIQTIKLQTQLLEKKGALNDTQETIDKKNE